MLYEVITLIEKIGEGGMGVIHRAVDTTLDREVAIKILPELFAQDPERLARFEREAKAIAALSHPNIAQIHGLVGAGGRQGANGRDALDTPAIVMELVEGPTLDELIRARFAVRTPDSETLEWVV